MAKKTDKPDDQLDFNFDGFDFKEPKDDRSPKAAAAMGAITGAKDGFISHLTSAAMMRGIYDEVLPKDYGKALDAAGKVHSAVKSNLYYAKSQMAGPIKQTKSFVNANVNKLEGKLPKGVVDKLKNWAAESRRSGPSASELAEASLTNELNAIFSAQHAVQQRDKAEEVIRESIADSKASARHTDTLDAMSRMSLSLERMVSYQDSVTIGYQRKSLELQMRHYAAMLESINLSKQGTQVIVANLQSIAENTKLPEFVKLKASERMQEVMRSNFMNKAYDRVFGGTDFIGGLTKVINRRGKNKIDDIKRGFEDALSGAEQLASMASLMPDDMSKNQKLEMAGSMGGSFLGESLANRAGKQIGKGTKWLLNKADPDGKHKAFGRKLSYGIDNPNAALSMIKKHVANKQDKNGENLLDGETWTGRTLSKLFELAEEVSGEVNKSGKLGMQVGGIKDFGEPGQLSYGAVRSLEEIIPGWLQRIHHNTAIMATGNPAVVPLSYDFSRGQFVSDKSKTAAISELLFSGSEKSHLNYMGDGIANIIDPENKLTPEQRKTMLATILKDNSEDKSKARRGDVTEFGRVTNSDTWKAGGASDEDASKISEVIAASLGEAFSEKHVEFARRANNFGLSIADKREAVQALINTGDVGLLRRIGLLDSENNFVPKKYLELLNQDKIDFGVDDTFLGSRHQKRRRTFAVGLSNNDPTIAPPPAPNASGTQTRVSEPNVNIDGRGTDRIVKSLDSNTDKMLERLDTLIDLTKDNKVQHNTYQLGLSTPLKWVSKAVGKGAKLVGHGISGVGRLAAGVTNTASNVMDWGRSKLDTLHDVFIEGQVEPRLYAWKLKAGEYRDSVTNEVIRSYQDMKNAVVDANGNIVLDAADVKRAFVRTPVGRKMITSLGASRSRIQKFADDHKIIGAPLKFAEAAWRVGGSAKDRVLENVAGKFDIYVGKEEQPRLFAYKLRLGHYRLKDTNEVVTKLRQITGDVVDENGNTVLTADEIKLAYYRSTFGKMLLSSITKAASNITSFVSGKFGSAGELGMKMLNKAKDLLDEPIDIYVDYDMKTPRLLAITMRAGGYVNDVNNELVTRPSHIVGQVRRLHDNKVVLTDSDLTHICDSNGRKIRSVRAKLFGIATSQLRLAKNLVVRGYKWGKEKLSGVLGKMSGFFGDTKGIDLTGFYDWITSNPVVDKLTAIHTLLDQRLPGGKEKVRSGEVRDRRGRVRKIGDQDGDGDVDGSNADKEQQEGKKGLKEKAVSKLSEASERAKKGIEAWRESRKNKEKADDESGFFSKIKDYIATAVAGLLGGAVTSIFGGGAAAAGAGAATTAAGTAATGAAATGAAASGVGTAAAGAAGVAGTAAAAGKASKLARLGSAMWTATKWTGKAAWWLTKASFKPTALIARGAMMAIPAVLSGIGAVLSSPVTLPAIAIAAVGYGIYKFVTRLKIGNTLKMRMAQYGFNGFDDKKTKAICEFEATIFSQVEFSGGVAKLDKTKSDKELLEKVRDIFGMDENNQKHIARFSRWYTTRFKPVYLSHLTAIDKLGLKVPLREVEDMEPEAKIKYIQATRGLQIDFSEIQSPFPEHAYLEGTAVDVSNFAEAAIAEAKKLAPEAAVPPVTKTPETLTKEGTPKTGPGTDGTSTTGAVGAATSAMTPTSSQPLTKTALDGTGKNVTISPTAMIIASGENAKVGALDAVRFRTYGLVDLEADKVEGLRTAERIAMKHVKVGAEKRVIFDSDLVKFGTDLAPAFGTSTSSTAEFTSLVSWVRDRFLPTYLNYASCLNVAAGKYDATAQNSLTPNDVYRTALYVRDTKDADNRSVWGARFSPWKGYTLNTDPSSVLANIEFLKEKSNKTPKAIEEKIDSVAEKAKKAAIKNNGGVDPADMTSKKDAPSLLQRFGNAVQEGVASANYHLDNMVDKAKNVFDAPTGPNVGKATSSMGIETNDLPVSGGKVTGNEDFATLVHLGESKRRGYNDYNRGSAKNAPSNKENIKLTDMTLEEIMRKQQLPLMNPDRLFAVGKYQVVTGTLRDAVRSLGLNVSEKFTPQLQERIFAEFLATKKKGRRALEGFVKGKSDNADAAVNDAALEWASLKGSSGSGAYEGVGTNHASIGAAAVKAALTRARTKYASLIKSGMAEERAYGIAIGAYKDGSAGTAGTAPASGASAAPGASGSSTDTYTPSAASDAAKRGGTKAPLEAATPTSSSTANTPSPQPQSDTTASYTPSVSKEKAGALSEAAKANDMTKVAYTVGGGSKMGSKEQATNMVARTNQDYNAPAAEALNLIAAEARQHTTLLKEIRDALVGQNKAQPPSNSKPALRPVNNMFGGTAAAQMPVDLSSSGLV